jgi:hypothetical protein
VSDDWQCPWCGEAATRPADASRICESRGCPCGATAIAAPSRDSDEIIDDAIAIFGIADGYLTPHDADRLAGLREIGVDVAEGRSLPAGQGSRYVRRVLWFRRRG